MFISFNEEATTAYDSLFDAPKLFGLEDAPQIYTLVQDRKCSINSQPFPQTSLSIPLYIDCSVSGWFTLKAIGLIETGKQMSVFLEDLKTGQWINLQQEAEYSFNYESGVDTDRLVLHFGSPNSIHKQKEGSIGIYASGRTLYVNMNNNAMHLLNIYNLGGKLVYSAQINSSGPQSYTLDIPPSIYFAKIMGESHQLIKKILIN